jgi:hypothetical protein
MPKKRPDGKKLQRGSKSKPSRVRVKLSADERIRRLAAIGVAVICSILTPNLGSAESLRHQATAQAHVYLLRSFMVFSPGIYDLAANFRNQGINATVHNQFEWPSLAEQAITNYRKGLEDRIIIIGHSSGADAAFSMADRLAQASIVPSLVATLDPVGTAVIDGKSARVVNLYIAKGGVPVARGQSIGDRLVKLELKDHNVWRAALDRTPSTVDQLILGHVLEAVAEGPPRRPPSPRVSARGHRRVAAVADFHSYKRHRFSASNSGSAGRPATEAAPQRGGLSPDERRALFEQFLEWRKNRSLDP